MKYDSIVQFTRLTNEVDENGKILCNILREFFKNIEIQKGTMHKTMYMYPCDYCVRAKTTMNEDVEIIRTENQVVVNVYGLNKQISSNILLDKKEMKISCNVIDNTGLYLCDGYYSSESQENGNGNFVVTYYDHETVKFVKAFQESIEMTRNGVPGKKDIHAVQQMLAYEKHVDNDMVRNVFLDQGFLPDEEIQKEILMSELIEMSTSIYKNNPSEFMNENKNTVIM